VGRFLRPQKDRRRQMTDLHENHETVYEDPFSIFARLRSKVTTLWLKATYRFPEFGKGVSVHYSCDVTRPASVYIRIKDGALVAPGVWLTVVRRWDETEARIVLGRRCSIGRRSTISARNYIEIGDNVLFAPSVLIMDHNHEYADAFSPILDQGVTEGGRIIIGKNCWLGYGCVIFCAKGELTVGENCVIGANSVVTRSVPPRSVVAGNPAKIIKTYDEISGQWRKVSEQDEKLSTTC
jgi:acetyltransferase-like isoleucine patch superfamily enzyme